MSNMQQSFNADHTKGQTQARTEEWMEATNTTPSEQREILCGNSVQAQLSAQNHNSAQLHHSADHHSSHHHEHNKQEEAAGFLQQTGEKMVHMAQDAVDTVKETLGMGDKK